MNPTVNLKYLIMVCENTLPYTADLLRTLKPTNDKITLNEFISFREQHNCIGTKSEFYFRKALDVQKTGRRI